MTVEFLLKSKNGHHYVYIALYQGDEMVQISTGEKTTIKEWDKPNRRPKNLDSAVAVSIGKMKDDINKIRRLMSAQDIEVTPMGLRRAYLESKKAKQTAQKEVDKSEEVESALVTSLVEKWKKEELFEYSAKTISAIKYSMKLFTAFIKKRYPKLERKELTLSILNQYAMHLDTLGIADSSHGLRIKQLRWFLEWMGMPESTFTKLTIRIVLKDERNIINLTDEELTMLEDYKPEGQERQKAKDMYLLVCYTGFRISDMKRINRHRIINDCIELTQRKNRRMGSVPILPKAREILERYDWKAPDISEVNVNLKIKEVCKGAKISTPTVFKRKQAGLLIETFPPKHELITLHTAIKTFIFLAGSKWGMKVEDIAAIVGKDFKTVMEYYYKPDLEAAKIKMLESANRSNMKVM